MSSNAAIAGSTGLVGSNILQILLTHSSFASVSAFTRKPLSPSDPHSRLRPIQDQDSSNWSSEFSSISPVPDVYFSALGTTRREAGGIENQRSIDYGLNLALARAAKERGARVFVLISAAGANKDSLFPYPKMKGELDDAIKELGFDKAVVVRPGLICGTRPTSNMALTAVCSLANFMGRISGNRMKDFWAQDAEVIARAAVAAGLECVNGSAPGGNSWVLSQSDVVRLGRTEWKGDVRS